jgi:hypothetical protein
MQPTRMRSTGKTQSTGAEARLIRDVAFMEFLRRRKLSAVEIAELRRRPPA